MTENDNSWFQEDDSWRKTTAHVNWATGRILAAGYSLLDAG